ncbi:MAG: type II toxin-antitoxin system HicA family toxin [Nitrospirae bacterium]|nr:type II toxin-antitoxin system HicA family toxin [Nitrospirota bacterium]
MKLPTVSGEELTYFLKKMGYQVIRQKGSHIRMRKVSEMGEHNITVPNHSPIAKGTLNDIVSEVSFWNNLSKASLIMIIES